jgi:exopolysaccharide biosynthesis polyprenyl glycosylphosphotransferase
MSASREAFQKQLSIYSLLSDASLSDDQASIILSNKNEVSLQHQSRIFADILSEHLIDEELIPSCALSHQQLRVKRFIDLFFAGIALMFFAIPMLVLAILVKLDSKGPVFYAQERVGLMGRRFKMLKFRSMRLDAEKTSGAIWAIRNDPRRTRLGRFLRASSLDELPQLFNVIKGEMSMVGPRPERPHFVEQFKRSVPNYDLRHRMPVGITGWAQVHGWRGDTSIQRRVGYDLFYMLHWSPLLDIKTLFLTLFRGFINRNAY